RRAARHVSSGPRRRQDAARRRSDVPLAVRPERTARGLPRAHLRRRRGARRARARSSPDGLRGRPDGLVRRRAVRPRRTGSARSAIFVLAACLGAARGARADAPNLFGFGPRSESLAGADLADPDPALSAYLNPAAAWRPGVRAALGYDAHLLRLTL